jgi:hypothetical protein
MPKKLPYYSSCVNWPDDKLDALIELVKSGEATEITLATFRKHADLSTCDDGFYGTKLSEVLRDCNTHFYKLHGVYWFKWSAIEYIFATESMIDSVMSIAIDKADAEELSDTP